MHNRELVAGKVNLSVPCVSQQGDRFLWLSLEESAKGVQSGLQCPPLWAAGLPADPTLPGSPSQRQHVAPAEGLLTGLRAR